MKRYTRSPTDISWGCMMTRCFNKNAKCYYRYGGRGITVCQFLKTSYRSLLGLIGPRPDGKTLDRINNSLNYSCGECDECRKWNWPMNLQWSTPSAQARNTRRNRLITLNGVTKCLWEWCQIYNLSYSRLIQRAARGWDGSTLLLPKVDCNDYATIMGQRKTIREWADQLGMNPSSVRFRIKHWPEKDLLLKKGQRPIK